MRIISNLPDQITDPVELATYCEDLAFERSILAKLDEDLRANGYAGDTTVAQLIFLCLYTRFLKRPVSAVVKGPPGSGKSFALRAALNYIPTTAYELFSGMSERALIYSGLDLKHRYLILQEAAGLADGVGRAFLRQLLSEDNVRYRTVQSTANGLVGQELPTIEGPAGLLMTTTANSLHPEDESRMLSIQLNKSPDRIRDTLLAQATTTHALDTERDMTSWHSLHKFVGANGTRVEVPYARMLAESLPTSHFRALRDFPQLLSLIRASALMHQRTRVRRADGIVVATAEDYAAVYALVADAISHGLDAAVPDRIRTVVQAVKEMLDEQTSAKSFPPLGYLKGLWLINWAVIRALFAEIYLPQ